MNNVGVNNTSTNNSTNNVVANNGANNLNDQCPEEARPVYVVEADVAVRLDDGGYLDGDALVAAAKATGADAVHPGYGFLSENAKFADILEAHGITFIGPTADHIRLMGDKIATKAKAIELGIPVVPGSDGEVKDVAEALKVGREMGFPVLVKAASGGGGRGMRPINGPDELEAKVLEGRREAQSAFGNGEGYLEKMIERARHVEVQVIVDDHGTGWAVGVRDCSVQRRSQKLIASLVDATTSTSIRSRLATSISSATSSEPYELPNTAQRSIPRRQRTASTSSMSSAPTPR